MDKKKQIKWLKIFSNIMGIVGVIGISFLITYTPFYNFEDFCLKMISAYLWIGFWLSIYRYAADTTRSKKEILSGPLFFTIGSIAITVIGTYIVSFIL